MIARCTVIHRWLTLQYPVRLADRGMGRVFTGADHWRDGAFERAQHLAHPDLGRSRVSS